MERIDLAGQISFVTGAGRGIGRAIAIALAEAGSDVVLAARTVAQLEETARYVESLGSRAVAVRTDVTDAESVERAVAQAIEQFGRLDILVNNAGSNNGAPGGAVGPMWEISADAWWHDVTVNLFGTFLCSQSVLPHMIARGSGRIINIATMSSSVPGPFDSAYGCSKAGVVRLTDSLAEELTDTGVAVFALSPGPVRTELTSELFQGDAGRQWLGELAAQLDSAWIPAEVPAASVVFLASGRADGLSGRLLRASQDLDDLASRAREVIAADTHQLRYRSE